MTRHEQTAWCRMPCSSLLKAKKFVKGTPAKSIRIRTSPGQENRRLYAASRPDTAIRHPIHRRHPELGPAEHPRRNLHTAAWHLDISSATLPTPPRPAPYFLSSCHFE